MSRDGAPENLTCVDSVVGYEEWILRNPYDHSQWISFAMDGYGHVRLDATDGDFVIPVGTLEWLADRANSIWEEGRNRHDHTKHSAGDR